MAEIPDAAVEIVAERMFRRYESEYDAGHLSWRDFADDARADLEAAAPVLAEATLAPLVKRHAPIRDEQWGGFYCGTCWTKGGSRPVWPCSESLVIAALIAALLPASRAEPASSPPTGTAGEGNHA